MSLDARTLYELLPAVHRSRDAEEGGALEALIGVVAQQIALLEEDLAQLYDDQFIETCADWVVPYIGDLVGYRQLHGVTAQISSPRAEVADTIRLRRGKGTAATLEQLARDVTGWEAHVVEYFQRLATTQYLNHPRPGNRAFADLRRPEPLERLNGPFDAQAHTVDVRRAASGARPNIPNVGVFLWRLRSYSVSASPAVKVDDRRYLFDPLGAPVALFSSEVPAGAGALTTTNVSQRLSRRALAAAKDKFYGADKSFFIDGVALDALMICNLSDAGGGAWAHTPPAGKVAVDPVLGRIAFGTARAAPPKVSYHYGFSSDLGGGSYDRLASFEALTPVVVTPTQKPTIQGALDAIAGGGAAEIADNGRYAETPAIKVTTAGARIELRGADKRRPLLSLGGEFLIGGADGAEASLNGLLIAGGRLRIAATPDNKLRRVTLRHCTLTPGIALTPAGAPAQPALPSLVVETGAIVEIDHCILGGLRVAPGAQVTIKNSVIDAAQQSGVAYAGLDGAAAGGPLTISDSTVIGKVHADELRLAENVIFLARLGQGDVWRAPVWAEKRQSGCVRFSYLPAGSRAPRPYRCQPAPGADPAAVQPVFTSLRYGDPSYCQLDRRTPLAIREGAEDGSEMGVFRELFQPQRETNLRVRLDEYLRFGLEAGFIFVT